MMKIIRTIKVGDGMTIESKMGPLVSQYQLDIADRYMNIAEVEGAKVVIGGKHSEVSPSGYYFDSTLITDVDRNSLLLKEEIFGPIFSVIEVDSFEEGIRLCNESPYGLAGCVFTRLISKAKIFANAMQAGMIHINQGPDSQAHVPFGGIKSSGVGAYSSGSTAKDFYMNDKIVYTR